jgi:hypothetical protein
MGYMSLGSYSFDRDPTVVTIPESQKRVATVDTYSGGAVFQWSAVIQGLPIELDWKGMTVAQYNQLRTLYLSSDEVVWDPNTGTTYNVIVQDLMGTYFEGDFGSGGYRKNVKMVLNIRSVV